MLRLTRREVESIILETSDGRIVVTLDRYRGSQMIVTIDAPVAVKVLRDELLEVGSELV